MNIRYLKYFGCLVIGALRISILDAESAHSQPAVSTQPVRSTTLAVLDFAVSGEVDPNGAKAAAARVRQELHASGPFVLVDREMMRERMTERDWTTVEHLDHVEELAARGRSLAVEKIIGGRLGSFGGLWTVDMRLVDVNTGREDRSFFQQVEGRMEDLLPVVAEGARFLTGQWATTQSTPVTRPAPPESATLNLDLGHGVVLECLRITAGSFSMGAPSEHRDSLPVHKVRITHPFYLGKYEVTQSQWQAVMGSNPSRFKGDTLPVENVSWNECQDFCRRVSHRTGYNVCLPSEAQWEYACRATSRASFCFGSTPRQLSEYGWCGAGEKSTHTVGTKKPNSWGLYDMHGNVWEWCQDWFGPYETGEQVDPVGPSAGVARVHRGGSWNYGPASSTCSNRGSGGAGFRAPGTLGFRAAVSTGTVALQKTERRVSLYVAGQ